METYQEKSDDPSNHYGGISRGAMNEIKDCIDALLAAVQNSEEYQKFEKYRDLLKENPELMDRVNAFRGNNFRLQNEANRDELFRGTEQLNRESRELRRDPLVNAFLDAELALCKLEMCIRDRQWTDQASCSKFHRHSAVHLRSVST